MGRSLSNILSEDGQNKYPPGWYLAELEKKQIRPKTKPGMLKQIGNFMYTYSLVGLLTLLTGTGVFFWYDKNHQPAAHATPKNKIHASVKIPGLELSLEKLFLPPGKEPEIAAVFGKPQEYNNFIKSIFPNLPKNHALFSKEIYEAFKKGGEVLVYPPKNYFDILSSRGWRRIQQTGGLDVKIKFSNIKSKKAKILTRTNDMDLGRALEKSVQDAKVTAAINLDWKHTNYNAFADARRAEMEKVCAGMNRSLDKASCLLYLDKNVYALISYTDELLREQDVNLPKLLVYAIPIVESGCKHKVPLQVQNGNKTFTVYIVSTGPSKDTGLYQITPPAFEQICYEVQNTPQIAAVYRNVMNVLIQGCDTKTVVGKAKQELYTRLRDNLTSADWDVFSNDINTNAIGGILYTAYCAMHGTGTAEDILAKYNGGPSVTPASNPKVTHHVKKGLEALAQLQELYRRIDPATTVL